MARHYRPVVTTTSQEVEYGFEELESQGRRSPNRSNIPARFRVTTQKTSQDIALSAGKGYDYQEAYGLQKLVSRGRRLVIPSLPVPPSEFTMNLAAGEPGARRIRVGKRYWCLSPEYPEDWESHTVQADGTAYPLYESQAVVLTQAESDARVGNLDISTLQTLVSQLWGGILPESVTRSALCTAWLSYFIRCNHDFGVVHAWISALREWYRLKWIAKCSPALPESISILLDRPGDLLENGDCQVLAGLVAPTLPRKLSELDGNKVIPVYAGCDQRPRRIWDICANRVVPTTWFPRQLLEDGHVALLSHAWAEKLHYVISNVNLKTWPIPLPADIEIETIRRDLLEYDVRFAWLDVLCLRQRMDGPTDPPFTGSVIAERNRLRESEWASDVPLIGAIYRNSVPSSTTFVYLSELGRAFTPSGCRRWLKRAWTMQETREPMRLKYLGDTRNLDPGDCTLDNQGLTLNKAVYLISNSAHVGAGPQLLDLGWLILAMKGRKGSYKVDRVGGLLYFCMSAPEIPCLARPLPVYDSEEKPSAAWERLVHAAAHVHTTDTQMGGFAIQLMEIFPFPSQEHWFPSWKQLKKYPDVSEREVQTEDGVKPKRNCRLRLYGGRLYRKVSLTEYWTNNGEARIHATTADFDGRRGKVTMKPCQRTQSDFLGEEVNQSGQYVLVDLTPMRRHDNAQQGVHIVIVCRELTPWDFPMADWDATSLSQATLTNANAYHYELRRVTTLHWRPSRRDPFPTDYIPFTPTMASKKVVMDGKIVQLWDPAITVTLQ